MSELEFCNWLKDDHILLFIYKPRDRGGDLIDNVAVGGKVVSAAGQQDEPRTGNDGGQPAAFVGRNGEVFLTVDDKRRNISLAIHLGPVATRVQRFEITRRRFGVGRGPLPAVYQGMSALWLSPWVTPHGE